MGKNSDFPNFFRPKITQTQKNHFFHSEVIFDLNCGKSRFFRNMTFFLPEPGFGPVQGSIPSVHTKKTCVEFHESCRKTCVEFPESLIIKKAPREGVSVRPPPSMGCSAKPGNQAAPPSMGCSKADKAPYLWDAQFLSKIRSNPGVERYCTAFR